MYFNPYLSSFRHTFSTSNQTFSNILPTETNDVVTVQSELIHLRQLLMEKETQLADAQLEALTSAHRIGQLQDEVARLQGQLGCSPVVDSAALRCVGGNDSNLSEGKAHVKQLGYFVHSEFGQCLMVELLMVTNCHEFCLPRIFNFVTYVELNA